MQLNFASFESFLDEIEHVSHFVFYEVHIYYIPNIRINNNSLAQFPTFRITNSYSFISISKFKRIIFSQKVLFYFASASIFPYPISKYHSHYIQVNFISAILCDILLGKLTEPRSETHRTQNKKEREDVMKIRQCFCWRFCF